MDRLDDTLEMIHLPRYFYVKRDIPGPFCSIFVDSVNQTIYFDSGDRFDRHSKSGNYEKV